MKLRGASALVAALWFGSMAGAAHAEDQVVAIAQPGPVTVVFEVTGPSEAVTELKASLNELVGRLSKVKVSTTPLEGHRAVKLQVDLNRAPVRLVLTDATTGETLATKTFEHRDNPELLREQIAHTAQAALEALTEPPEKPDPAAGEGPEQPTPPAPPELQPPPKPVAKPKVEPKPAAGRGADDAPPPPRRSPEPAPDWAFWFRLDAGLRVLGEQQLTPAYGGWAGAGRTSGLRTSLWLGLRRSNEVNITGAQSNAVVDRAGGGAWLRFEPLTSRRWGLALGAGVLLDFVTIRTDDVTPDVIANEDGAYEDFRLAASLTVAYHLTDRVRLLGRAELEVDPSTEQLVEVNERGTQVVSESNAVAPSVFVGLEVRFHDWRI